LNRFLTGTDELTMRVLLTALFAAIVAVLAPLSGLTPVSAQTEFSD